MPKFVNQTENLSLAESNHKKLLPIEAKFLQAVTAHNLDKVESMLKAQEANNTLASCQNNAPICIAATFGYTDIIYALLNHRGVDPNSIDQSQQNAIYLAFKNKRLEAFEALITSTPFIGYYAEPGLQQSLLNTIAKTLIKSLQNNELTYQAFAQAFFIKAAQGVLLNSQPEVIDLLKDPEAVFIIPEPHIPGQFFTQPSQINDAVFQGLFPHHDLQVLYQSTRRILDKTILAPDKSENALKQIESLLENPPLGLPASNRPKAFTKTFAYSRKTLTAQELSQKFERISLSSEEEDEVGLDSNKQSTDSEHNNQNCSIL